MSEMKLTERGFRYLNFEDGHGEKCSIQKSSQAFVDAIWFGADELGIKHFVPYRTPDSWEDVDVEKLLGVTKENGQSIIGNNRVLLTRVMVENLLPILQEFVETGELPPPE